MAFSAESVGVMMARRRNRSGKLVNFRIYMIVYNQIELISDCELKYRY